MRKTQRYAQRLRLAKPATEYLRGHSERRPQAVARERAESPLTAAGILRLQHSIGNQAVQRLIIQRQPGKGGGGAKEPASMPAIVATITFQRAGKLEGTSRLAGHEGKVELSSLSFVPSRGPGVRTGDRNEREAEPEKRMELAFTKPQDKTTVELQKAFMDGDKIATATFEFLRRDDNGDVVVAGSFEFSNGLITSLHIDGSGPTPSDAGTIEFVEPAK
jgi:type VI protein secretion system component Hcp